MFAKQPVVSFGQSAMRVRQTVLVFGKNRPVAAKTVELDAPLRALAFCPPPGLSGLAGLLRLLLSFTGRLPPGVVRRLAHGFAQRDDPLRRRRAARIGAGAIQCRD